MLLNEDEENKVCKQIEQRVSVDKVAILYSLSKLFNLSSLSEVSLLCMERCFAMFADSRDFLELEFAAVSKLLSSKELHIDSELQVFNATSDWLSHDATERSKFANVLLMKTRLSLLSDHVLNDLLINPSPLYNYKEFTGIIQKVLRDKNNLNRCNVTPTIRYCEQTKFYIALCGYRNISLLTSSEKLKNTEINSFTRMNILPSTMFTYMESRAVCVKGQLYVFGAGNDGDSKLFVQKYSYTTKIWEKLADMYDGCFNYCACSFMDKVFILGGSLSSSCIEFNTTTRKWRQVARMKESRRNSSCTVFEGRVVVSGNSSFLTASSVEAYDHIAEAWHDMPNMVERRHSHKSVAIRNKLFVIGGITSTGEVFDSNCKQFVLLKLPTASVGDCLFYSSAVVTSGNKLVIFSNRKNNILFYDVENDEFSDEECEAAKICQIRCSAKVPHF